MQVGFIGSGNMARALARGWGDPVLCTDSGSGRARALAAELGGEALDSNRELAERADVVILAHKPAQLAEVAWEAAGAAKAVVSLLGAHAAGRRCAPRIPVVPVFRVEPNTAVEIRRGVLAFAEPDAPSDAALRGSVQRAVRARRHRRRRAGAADVGRRRLLGRRPRPTGRCSSRRGSTPRSGAGCRPRWPRSSSTETMAGTAELLRDRDGDTLAVRREVASPGGTTARGLAALERGGVRAAFSHAMDDVVGG